MISVKDNQPKLHHHNAVISLCGCGVNLPQQWVLRDVFED